MPYNPPAMRIALAQLNPIVGDVPGNTALVLDAIEQARRDGASLLVTSELVVLGYPPRDLLLREGIVAACKQAVSEIAEAAGELTVIVGHPRHAPEGVRGCRNSVSVCRNGEVLAVYDKQLLPGYDVFDEDRYFDRGNTPCIVEVEGTRIGLAICEDIWCAKDVASHCAYETAPVAELMQRGCDVIAAVNASPFVTGKFDRHLVQLREIAQKHNVPIISVNQIGANDDLVFDGRSVVVNATGNVHTVLPAFASAVETIDLTHNPQAPSSKPVLEEIFHALVLGVRDYCRKTGHSRVHVGLSGGIDSALTASIAAAALGAENVIGVLMPSRHSSKGSIDDARALIDNLGLSNPVTLTIKDAHTTILNTLQHAAGDVSGGLADQNIQARLRGVLLMALSNASGSLVLATSNKSEIAVGYSTLYGDMCGAISVLGDVLKTRVYELSRWINEHWEQIDFSCPPIPEASITKPPSAELAPSQVDEDSLPPYDVLDQIIERLVEREQSPEQIIEETGLDAELVEQTVKMIDRSEYKRNQAAVILKVSPRAFGRGRVMPIVMKGLPVHVRAGAE